MAGFVGMGHNGPSRTRQAPDCLCVTCDKDIHHLGIMSHRAMHRRRYEDCTIEFSDGRTVIYRFSESKKPSGVS